MRFTERETATILAALEAWKDELQEGAEWIAECYDFRSFSPLTRDEIDDLRTRLKKKDQFVTHDHVSDSWSTEAPTFIGHQRPSDDVSTNEPEFVPPYVPIHAYEEDGVRIILGANDDEDGSKPDLKIERRPHGWAFFLHPNAGDPIAFIYLLDDGRSYLMHELLTELAMEIVTEIPHDLDHT
jgi:hypothetical protein